MKKTYLVPAIIAFTSIATAAGAQPVADPVQPAAPGVEVRHRPHSGGADEQDDEHDKPAGQRACLFLMCHRFYLDIIVISF